MTAMSVSIRLTKATPKQVRFACMNYHYAKSVPSAQVAFACYEDNKFVGVIVYGSGANNNAAKEFKLVQGQTLELVRVALNQSAHKQPTSQYVARSLKLLPKVKPLVRVVTSYADYTNQGHLGKIYQACNFLCMGKRTAGKDAYYIVDGKMMHGRSLRAKYGSKEKAKLHHTVEDVSGLVKILYIWCYDSNMRAELESKAIGFQSIESGAIPTSSHQKASL